MSEVETSPSAAASWMVCQPGSMATSTRASTTPPRSARTVKVCSPTCTSTSAYGTGGETKLRQPRTPSSTTLARRRPFSKASSGAITTRESTRIQEVVPYPVKESTVGWLPRRMAKLRRISSKRCWTEVARRSGAEGPRRSSRGETISAVVYRWSGD